MLTNWKKYSAEAIGTFSLSLVVLALLATKPDLTPFGAALALGLFVYTIGELSGSQINPSVSLAALCINQLSWKDAIAYVLAQLVGGFIALISASLFIQSLITKIATPDTHSLFAIGCAEAIGTFFLGFGVASVIYKKTPPMASGIVVGGSLLLGIFIASSLGSKGILNPVVAIMTGNAKLGYLLGPIIGAVVGMWIYKKVIAKP